MLVRDLLDKLCMVSSITSSSSDFFSSYPLEKGGIKGGFIYPGFSYKKDSISINALDKDGIIG